MKMNHDSELASWLDETMQVFPEIKRRAVKIRYKPMSMKTLGRVNAKIEQKLDFDPEALLLGEKQNIRKRRLKPKEFVIQMNSRIQAVKNEALRKEIVQYVILHELLHIKGEDLLTISKDYSRRKKKRIHVSAFESEVFRRFNELRRMRGIMEIEKLEHLEAAVSRIWESVAKP